MGFMYWVIDVDFPPNDTYTPNMESIIVVVFRQNLAENFQYLMYKGHAFKSFKPSIDTSLFEPYFDKSAFKLNWHI